MKRTALVMICLILFCSSTAFASPLRDYSPGKAAVDITATNLTLKSTPAYWDSKVNAGFGLTLAVAQNWAVQYKYHNWSASRTYGGATLSTTASVNELNLLYKLDQNFSAFAGATNISGNLGNPIHERTAAQFGLIATVPLAEKFTGWGLLGAGSNNVSAELGVGYALSKQLELNLFYMYKYFNDVSFSNVSQSSFNARNQGFGLGVTATF